jgi:hypothetical protein
VERLYLVDEIDECEEVPFLLRQFHANIYLESINIGAQWCGAESPPLQSRMKVFERPLSLDLDLGFELGAMQATAINVDLLKEDADHRLALYQPPNAICFSVISFVSPLLGLLYLFASPRDQSTTYLLLLSSQSGSKYIHPINPIK